MDPTTAIWATLVGLTAGEGLALNRAFLLQDNGEALRGRFGVGPASRAEAGALWSDLRRRGVRPLDDLTEPDPAVIAAEQGRHAALLERLGHPLSGGCAGWQGAFIARSRHPHPCVRHWVEVLESEALLVAPMRGGERPWGVIVADNFVTRAPIAPAAVQAAETLAHALTVALERTELFERLATEHRQRLVAEQAAALADAARGLAHDLKNPLALAGGLARELSDAPPADSETVERHLAIIADAVARAEERVARLADGIAAKATEVTLVGVNVGLVCDRIVELFRPLALCRNVRLACYHPSLPLLASASLSGLERCLENLIGNAIQALAGRAGRVQVSARRVGDQIAVEVADDGPPLPSALRPDPFSGGLSTRHGGSGLGLASVRHVVTAMGGRIEYDEEEPGWIRFVIYLRRWA